MKNRHKAKRALGIISLALCLSTSMLLGTSCQAVEQNKSSTSAIAQAEVKEDYMDIAEKLIKPVAEDSIFEKRENTAYGTVKKLTYYSQTAERDTPVNVILPPNYSSDKEYPVLYILHGFTDTQDWMLRDDVALVNMLGNLTSDGEIKEMIVVLPYIFCDKNQQFVNGFDISASPSYDNFINDLKTDLLDFINSTFPIKQGRENAAITGFSMGGRESLFIGVQMSDVFGYVGAACPAPGLTPVANSPLHPGQLTEDELKYDKSKGVPYLTFITKGESDNVVGDSPLLYHNLLTKNGNRNLFHTVPLGNHNASSVKQHLYNFTRMIFAAEENSYEDISFKDLTADEKNITLTVTNSGSTKKVYALAAYYDKNDKLVNVSINANTELKNGENTIQLENKSVGSYIKTYLWSGTDTMIPIANPQTVKQIAASVYPDNKSEEVFNGSSTEYEVDVNEMRVKNGSNSIYGKLYTPKKDGACPTVIFSHGYNGCNEDFADACMFLAKNGFNAYSYDFCGGSTRSKSSGSSTDMTIFTEKSDLLAVIDHIKTMDNVDKDKLYLLGGSQGGLVSALAAEERVDSINGMILLFPAFNIPDDWSNNFKSESDIPETYDFWGLTLGKGFFTSIRDFKTFDNIGKFNKNVLIIHGDKDVIVPVESSQKASAVYPNAELVILPGEGHGFSPDGNKTAMRLSLQLFQN